MADQWEYMFLSGVNMEPELNRLGAQGWEAVGITPTIHTQNRWVEDKYTHLTQAVTEWAASSYSILLKRRKP